MTRLFVLMLLIAGAIPAQAANLPPEFTANYSIRKGLLEIGKATRTFGHATDGSLVYTSESRTSGMTAMLFPERVVQTTRLEKKDGFIRPLDYRYQRDGKKKKSVTQTYQWQKGEVTSRVDGETFQYAIPPRTLDQNIYQLGIMLNLADGKRSLHYSVGENVRLKGYEVTSTRREIVVTQLLGRIDTIVVRSDDDNVHTILWCAPELAYLPVRIEHTEDGTTFSAVIEGLSGIPRPKKSASDGDNWFD